MREKIRVSTLYLGARRCARRRRRRSRSRGGKAKAAYAALEPSDLLNKHAWLFRDAWVEESADEVEDIEKMNFQERAERMYKLRVAAMREVRDQRGYRAS